MAPSMRKPRLVDAGHHPGEVDHADAGGELAGPQQRADGVDGGGAHHHHRHVGVVAQVGAVGAGGHQGVHVLAGGAPRSQRGQRLLEAAVEDVDLGLLGHERGHALEGERSRLVLKAQMTGRRSGRHRCSSRAAGWRGGVPVDRTSAGTVLSRTGHRMRHSVTQSSQVSTNHMNT